MIFFYLNQLLNGAIGLIGKSCHRGFPWRYIVILRRRLCGSSWHVMTKVSQVWIFSNGRSSSRRRKVIWISTVLQLHVLWVVFTRIDPRFIFSFQLINASIWIINMMVCGWMPEKNSILIFQVSSA